MITQKELKNLLHYCPETGAFTWIYSAGAKKAGSSAGSKKSGYIYIQIDKVIYKAHRLAWLYMCGIWPKNIDHINHVKSDNKFLNLRNTSHRENMRNRTISKNNKSGINGVFFYKRDSIWVAQIEIDRINIYLGRFKDKFEAICARLSANNKYGFHKNHGSSATESA